MTPEATRGVVGVADADAGDIGEEVFQGAGSVGSHLSGVLHGYISRSEMLQLPSASRIILASSDLR